MDTLKSTNVQMLWGDIDIDEPRVEITPRAPSVQPSRVEAEDEELLIRSFDNEGDEERERIVDETFESLYEIEEVELRTALERSLRETHAPTLSEAMPAQSTDARSSSTSTAPIPPSVVEPIIVETSVVKAPIDVDPSAASSAKVDVRVTPGVETRIDKTVSETGTETRDVLFSGIDDLIDAVTGAEAQFVDEPVTGTDARVDDAPPSSHSPQA